MQVSNTTWKSPPPPQTRGQTFDAVVFQISGYEKTETQWSVLSIVFAWRIPSLQATSRSHITPCFFLSRNTPSPWDRLILPIFPYFLGIMSESEWDAKNWVRPGSLCGLHTDLDKWCFWLLGVLKMPGLGILEKYECLSWAGCCCFWVAGDTESASLTLQTPCTVNLWRCVGSGYIPYEGLLQKTEVLRIWKRVCHAPQSWSVVGGPPCT
jgi:hypothetical protein